MFTDVRKVAAAAMTISLMTAVATATTQVHATPAAGLNGSWVIDPLHTNINFSIRHMGISQVRGRFDDIAGTIVADAAQPRKSAVQFTIQAASIDTNVKMRDDDLRSKNYFDVAKYPTIKFKSTRIDKVGSAQYLVRGYLTIHGVTKAIVLPCRVKGPIKDPFGGARFGLETQVRLDRHDFGVGNQQKLTNGDFAIGNQVDVTISIEATPPKKAVPNKAKTAVAAP